MTYVLRHYQTNQVLEGRIAPELIAASLSEPSGTGAVRATCLSVTRPASEPREIGKGGPVVWTGTTESVWTLDPDGNSTVYVEAVRS